MIAARSAQEQEFSFSLRLDGFFSSSQNAQKSREGCQNRPLERGDVEARAGDRGGWFNLVQPGSIFGLETVFCRMRSLSGGGFCRFHSSFPFCFSIHCSPCGYLSTFAGGFKIFRGARVLRAFHEKENKEEKFRISKCPCQ